MANNGFSDIDLIETTDEEGKLHVFEKVEEIDIDGQRYALLIYQGSGDDADGEEKAEGEEGYDEEVVVMKISQEDGAEVYEAIEDEAEFERVIAHIESITDDDADDAGESPEAGGGHVHGPGCSHGH
jgi:hypothetical protein